MDIISLPLFGGVKAIGFCGKVGKGLINGYNPFLKTKQYKMYKPSGKGWQKKQAKIQAGKRTLHNACRK